MPKHIDALTGQVFDTEEEYLNHVSPVTGFTPQDIEHHGINGVMVAKASLQRSNSLSQEAKDDLDSKIDMIQGSDMQDKLSEARAKSLDEVPKAIEQIKAEIEAE